MAIEYKIFELTSSSNLEELEERLNKFSSLGFKISHIVPGYGTAGHSNYCAKLILEKYIPDDTTPYR